MYDTLEYLLRFRLDFPDLSCRYHRTAVVGHRTAVVGVGMREEGIHHDMHVQEREDFFFSVCLLFIGQRMEKRGPLFGPVTGGFLMGVRRVSSKRFRAHHACLAQVPPRKRCDDGASAVRGGA